MQLSLDDLLTKPGWYRGLNARIHYTLDRRQPFLCGLRTDKADSPVGGVKKWGNAPGHDHCTACWRAARDLAKQGVLPVARSKGKSRPDLPGQSTLWSDA